MRKFKRAVTDSDTENCVRFDPKEKPGVSNLINIYSAVHRQDPRRDRGGVRRSGLRRLQARGGRGRGGDPASHPGGGYPAHRRQGLSVESVYKQGAEKASYVANKTLRKVYKKIGFLQI